MISAVETNDGASYILSEPGVANIQTDEDTVGWSWDIPFDNEHTTSTT